jgi:hypothetical protein
MLKFVVAAAAILLASISVASAKGERSTAFYNNHNYTINPNGGVATITRKGGGPTTRRQRVK